MYVRETDRSHSSTYQGILSDHSARLASVLTAISFNSPTYSFIVTIQYRNTYYLVSPTLFKLPPPNTSCKNRVQEYASSQVFIY
jgi:hypothetical protein